MKNKIGFIGLGIMGRPMAENLLKAGYALVICSSNSGTRDGLRQLGAEIVGHPKAVASASEVIICMLPDAPQIREVAFGPDGVFEGLSEGKLFIDMSTTDAATELEIMRKFNTKGADTLDAPVSGGQKGAVGGTLSIMVGGAKTGFDRAKPIFDVLGTKITHMGDHGAGQITKSCNQIATALVTQGIIEAFTLAAACGIDLALLKEVMSGGFADSRALAITGQKIIQKDFKPGFKVELYRKDLRIACQAGADRKVDLPGAELVSGEMDALLRNGKGELDFSALIQVFEK